MHQSYFFSGPLKNVRCGNCIKLCHAFHVKKTQLWIQAPFSHLNLFSLLAECGRRAPREGGGAAEGGQGQREAGGALHSQGAGGDGGSFRKAENSPAPATAAAAHSAAAAAANYTAKPYVVGERIQCSSLESSGSTPPGPATSRGLSGQRLLPEPISAPDRSRGAPGLGTCLGIETGWDMSPPWAQFSGTPWLGRAGLWGAGDWPCWGIAGQEMAALVPDMRSWAVDRMEGAPKGAVRGLEVPLGTQPAHTARMSRAHSLVPFHMVFPSKDAF